MVIVCSIGSLGKELKEDGVQNVTLTNAVFSGSDNGVRIKSWARPSTGFVRNILFQNIIMKNVENPIIIDQNYCPNDQACPNQVLMIVIPLVYIYKGLIPSLIPFLLIYLILI